MKSSPKSWMEAFYCGRGKWIQYPILSLSLRVFLDSCPLTKGRILAYSLCDVLWEGRWKVCLWGSSSPPVQPELRQRAAVIAWCKRCQEPAPWVRSSWLMLRASPGFQCQKGTRQFWQWDSQQDPLNALVPSWDYAQSSVLERLKLGCRYGLCWQTRSSLWAIDWQQGPLNVCLAFVLQMEWKQKCSVLVISVVSSLVPWTYGSTFWRSWALILTVQFIPQCDARNTCVFLFLHL